MKDSTADAKGATPNERAAQSEGARRAVVYASIRPASFRFGLVRTV